MPFARWGQTPHVALCSVTEKLRKGAGGVHPDWEHLRSVLLTAERLFMYPLWPYPPTRYYDDGYQTPPAPPTDGDIKAGVIDRLRENPHTKDDYIRVDVSQGVVVLGGRTSSALAKRTAGDDAWGTPGVADVSNQLVVGSTR